MITEKITNKDIYWGNGEIHIEHRPTAQSVNVDESVETVENDCTAL